MTPFSDVFELFLAGIKDYKIDKLYKLSVEDAEFYMKPFLIRAITRFKKCKKNLENRNDETKIFNEDLNTDEKVILADLMIIEWLTKEVNDILQMKLHLQDSDFKTYSSAQNLKEKREHLYATIEIVDKRITQYGYDNIDWSIL